MKKKVVLIRTDKIGDLISSLCCDEMIPADFQASWILSKGMSWLAEHAVPGRTHFEVDLNSPWKSFSAVLRYLRQEKPEALIHLQGPWWIPLAAWMAGVPARGGRRSQWFSFLFLNRGFRQSRRESNRHEAEYNQDLVENFFSRPHRPLPPLQLAIPRSSRWMEQWGLSPRSYVVVHPGMAGSALNWPPEFYEQLVERLNSAHKVVLTGTRADREMTENLRMTFSQHKNVTDLSEQLSPVEWMHVLKNAKVVIGPSTGVVHVAASLGAKVLGLYSPVQVQNVTRWGPRGLHVLTMTPKVQCPGVRACLGVNCEQYSCMKLVTPGQVLEALRPWLSQSI